MNGSSLERVIEKEVKPSNPFNPWVKEKINYRKKRREYDEECFYKVPNEFRKDFKKYDHNDD